MNNNRLDLSISIVNWNTRDLLKQCLNSIIDTVQNIKYEILVVDNASTDGSVDMLKDSFPEVITIANIDNKGFAAGNNQAIKKSSGEAILILNPDIIALPNAINNMLDFLKKDCTIGGIGCKLLNRDGTVQEKGFFRRYPSVIQVLLFYTVLNKISCRIGFLSRKFWEYIETDKGCDVEQTPGACTMIKKAVFDDIGLMDEGYKLFFEDVDLCYRIRKAGWRLYYFTGASMIHYGMQSFNSWNGLDIHIRFNSSLLIFMKRYGSVFSAALAYMIIVLNETVKNIVKIFIYPFYDIKGNKKRTIRESVYFLYCLFKVLRD